MRENRLSGLVGGLPKQDRLFLNAEEAYHEDSSYYIKRIPGVSKSV